MSDLKAATGKVVAAIHLIKNELHDTQEVRIEFTDGTAVQFILMGQDFIPFIDWNFIAGKK